MSARDDILGKVRARRTGMDAAEPATRLRERPAGPSPARAGGSGEVLRERFMAMAARACARVEPLPDLAALPNLVARLCAERKFTPAAAVAPDPRLAELDWEAGGIAAETRAARADDALCLSHALCGVAETGTLVLRSGPSSPVTLNFLPDVHIVALAAADIVGGYEQAWDRVRAPGAMPRTINWITGPSRSADIEQTHQLGAHGPKALVIALY